MTDTLSPPELPSELYTDLRAMNPASFEFQKDFEALKALAAETGHAALTMEQLFPPIETTPPSGFNSEFIVPGGAELPLKQFEGKIHSLTAKGETAATDVHRLVTDSGMPIRYCDLRPLMTHAVQRGGPSQKSETEALDRAFTKDLKFMAETGHSQNNVKDVPGVHYTKLGNTKIRSYWMNVAEDKPGDGPLVARLADCANAINSEKALYRRVFNKPL